VSQLVFSKVLFARMVSEPVDEISENGASRIVQIQVDTVAGQTTANSRLLTSMI